MDQCKVNLVFNSKVTFALVGKGNVTGKGPVHIMGCKEVTSGPVPDPPGGVHGAMLPTTHHTGVILDLGLIAFESTPVL